MLYLCLAMILDVAIFTMGLTMSIIDVNRYNFGLYLVLMSVVAFSLLVALWVAKPKFCRTPNWAIQLYLALVKSPRTNYQAAAGEDENLIRRRNADEIIRSIKGIPFLIQAIQYSLEAAYVAPARDSTTPVATVTDSAIDSTNSNNDSYPKVVLTQCAEIVKVKRAPGDGRGRSHTSTNTGAGRTSRRAADLKRQSIFVVFPYSETLPIEQTKLKMRRSSSDHDLGRKSSFEQFCAAVISGQSRRASKLSSSEGRLELNEQKEGNERTGRMAEAGHGKLDSLKRTEMRRPSLEVRYVGLQSMLMAKMTAKQN